MYQNPSCSLRDIIKYFRENDVVYMRTDKYGGNHAGKLNIASLSTMLSNPVYVRADKDVYAYFMSKGYEILDEPQAYDSIHGVFKHEKSDGTFYVKTAYHEGLVDSETWLAVQDKKAHNICFSSNKKPKNSWLVGLVKCAECGHAVVIDKHKKKKSGKEYRYLTDHGWETIEGCSVVKLHRLRTLSLLIRQYRRICRGLTSDFFLVHVRPPFFGYNKSTSFPKC
jgi:hypothetical protein